MGRGPEPELTDAPPIVVLAAPGAGGAQLAAALADASGRPVAAWDEVTDEPLGDGEVVRTACREVLWRRERDWTCPPGTLEVDDVDRTLTAPLQALLTSCPAPVVYDVTLPFLLSVLLEARDELLIVVAVRDPREAVPHLLSGQQLESGASDELLRVVNERLVVIAAVDEVTVVKVGGDLDLAVVAADVMESEVGRSRRLPDVTAEGGVEVDSSVESLWSRVDARPPSPISGSVIPIEERGEEFLDRYRGPRTAARRALLHGIAALDDPRGEVLECTRAMGIDTVLPGDRDAQVAYVDGFTTLRRAVTVAPASLSKVLLTDVGSWCGVDELRAVFELVMGTLRYGGAILMGRSAADDDRRQQSGLAPLDDDDITAAAREIGLVPLPVQHGGNVRALSFVAHTAIAGTVQDLESQVARLEEHLARRTEQRDAAAARYEALRERRVVRAVLGVADTLGDVARRLRGAADD